MKKYIYIIVFLLGLLFNFYLGYSACISESQSLLVENAVSSKDYDFFLKFHSYHDEDADFKNDNVLINKIYLSEYDQVGYNLIIVNLNESALTNESDEIIDEMKIILTGEDGSFTIDYTTTAYLYLNIINLQISKTDIVDNCGLSINNIEVLINEDVLISIDVNINTDELTKENVISKTEGYTQEEMKELLKVTSYNQLGVQLLYFIGVFSVVSLVIGLILFINKRKFKGL